VRHDLFTFDPPTTGVPVNWLAFGASLTQGTKSLGITPDSQLHAVSGLIGRHAGIYLGLPLLTDNALPGLQLSDFTPDCVATKGQSDFIAQLFDTLKDPATNLLDLRRARIDWRLTPRNLAIGGSRVSDTVLGGEGTLALIEHIVEDPDVEPRLVLSPSETSQLERVEAFDPDIGFVTDLLANDIDRSIEADDLRVDNATPLETVQSLLAELMARLGKLHGQYFIANMPYFTFVPGVGDVRRKRIAAGTDTAESFDAKVRAIDDLTDAYNEALVAAMASHPNLHLVDFRGQVETIRGAGLIAGGELCTVGHFGGLLSLDDLHFSDTGYAAFANLFIDAINAELGSQIPRVDVDAVHADDPLAPAKLHSAGFTCVPPP